MPERMLRHLILVPTEHERRIVGPLLASGQGASDRVELCGFGPVAAAARTCRLLCLHPARRVILVGIAGRFDDRLAVGSACRFHRVACHGIGAGSGADFMAAGALGWLQWPGDPPDPAHEIGDVLPCTTNTVPTAGRTELLLTTCAAAASDDDVRHRRRLHPEATAEDMEGFGVALACRLCATPVDIVRGISNTAGDRAKSRWRVSAALEAAAAIVLALMAEAS
jgi:futalosine hydrolase